MSFGEGNLRERCAELERALIAEQVENERLRKRIEELERRLEVQENETACQSVDLVAEQERCIKLEQLVRDAEWLLLRATWTDCEQDSFAADWFERMAELGIEAD